MRKTWKRALAVVCAAAMVFTSVNISPALEAKAATIESGDEWLTTTNDLSVKITVQYTGTGGDAGVMAGIDQTGKGYSESTADVNDLVDGDTSTGVILRGGLDGYDADGLAAGDYIQVDFKEAVEFSGASFIFSDNTDDRFHASTFSYKVDGEEWTELGTIDAAQTMSYETTEAISGVTAIKLTNTEAARAWVRLMDISIDAEVVVVVDRTALDGALAAAAALNEADYTADSWSVLAAAVTAANELGEDATQEAVDNAATAITNAIAGLEEAEEAEPEVDITSGMIAHYDFEEVEGTSVPNVVDSETYTGTLSGTTSISEEGKIGDALELGSQGGMQLNNIVNASNSSFSVSMWYKGANETFNASNANLVQAGTIGGSTGRTILILDNNEQYYTYVTGDNNKVRTATPVTHTEWQHITFAYEYDAETETAKAYFYVNGELDHAEGYEDGISLSGTALDTADMIIGRHRNNEGQFMGLIDEVRVYNTAVTAEQAAAIYAYAPETEEVVVDRTALDAAIAEATALNEADYTADSWSVLAAAVEAANKLGEDATQEAVDSAATAITNAIAALEEAEEEAPTIEVSDRVQGIIDNMSVREKVTQMLMVDFRKWDSDLTDEVAAQDFTVMNEQVQKIVEDYDFGAIIYFANNIKETEQSYNLTMAMQEAATKDGGIPLLISADQEGGSVYRLGSGTALPGNMALGATFNTEYAKAAGEIIGSELSVLGINTNLAPVVDVNNNANNPVIGLRSYGDDATAVGEMASASIAGMAEYNVIGCAKHFPGHGDTATDSHYGLPSVDKSYDVLIENELKPYTVAIEEGIEMIMTAHILYPQLESDTILSEKTGEEESLPATMSDDIVTGLLKGEMGFEGIVCTDAMNMAGISANWDQVQSVKIAIASGVDMICMPCTLYDLEDLADLDAIIDGVVAAVENGEIPESRLDDACARILNVKENRGILDYDAEDYSLEEALATVGSDENRAKEREIAAAAVTVVKNENDVLPLDITADTNVLMLVPYTNEISQMLMGWNRAIDAGIIPYGAEVDYYRFSSATINDTLQAKLEWADIVIINSEISSTARMAYKHWLSALPNAVADYCKENGKISVISSVDKPYDVQLYPNADAIVAAYGCKGSSVDVTEALIGGATGSTAAYGPNIIAAVEVALGTYGAQGKLPVTVPVYDVESNSYTEEVAYARGYGLTYDAKEAIAVDKTALNDAVIANGYIDVTEATEESAQAYADALAAAKAVLADEETTQYAVEVATIELTAAVAGLVTYVEGDEVENYVNIIANSEMNPADGNDGPATWAFDGDDTHWWHSRWGNWDQMQDYETVTSEMTGKPSETNPIWIQAGFGEALTISQVEYKGRDNGMGLISTYIVSVANLEDPAATPTDDDFTVVANGTLAITTDAQTITFDAVEATHVRITATGAYKQADGGVADGDGHVAATTINVYTVEEAPLDITLDVSALQTLVDECDALDTDAYTAETAEAFTTALAAAKDVLAQDEITAQELDAAIKALEVAKEALVAVLDSVAVTTAPAKVAYEAGETFDPAGLVLTLTYKDGSTADVAYGEDTAADFTFAPALDTALTTDVTEVTVTYAEKEATVAITVTISVDPTDDSLDVPVDMYTATAGSTQSGGSTGSAIDGNSSTFWEVVWDIGATDPSVLWYQIELDEAVEIDAVRYLPRWGGDAGNTNGFIKGYIVYVSNNGEDWTAVAEGTWAFEEGWKIATFAPVEAKYVRLLATDTYADVDTNFGTEEEVSSNMSIAEIRVKATSVVINKAALKAAIATAESKSADDYTTASWEAADLANVITAAQAVVDNADATQEEVDEATATVNAAVAKLVGLANKTALATAINKAKALDASLYTEESMAAVTEALAAAEAVYAERDAAQADVTAAAKALNDAIKALVEIPAEVVRIAGAGRIDTALEVADTLKETLGLDKFDTVIIATSKTFADALPGSYLAYVENAPILLISDARMDDVVAYVKANLVDNGKVYILGGEAAVSASLEGKLEGYTVDRLAGAGRYETNLMILDRANVTSGEIIVATGKTFADSLSASAAKLPILMVKDTLNTDQKAFLEGMNPSKIHIVGGESAVSAVVAAELAAYGTVERVAGANRRETSIEVAKKFFENPDMAVVASASNFPDGLCGGPLAAALNAPLVLTVDGKTTEAAAYTAELGIESGYVLGGTGVLADDSVVNVFALESAEDIILK